ncbi:DUF167 domain-containing protein [Candidatus Parcubacteria bacterium]|nr:DUF167 domain-containing protein [Patescibacteria group bacterium]MBU4309177.1 DUF167 domain-containing protein [Patescibacteria group bacterium]MBU4432700.1 DUF167 domain-containing protein [Patescibacteria group bacterium]MBU4577538.1 DUF167 domain-containing protein [Patescibacteria group bacterium]MCG2697225.1 DUF167 domain-containing protein [Candidatus Parcubacteria bacterium]
MLKKYQAKLNNDNEVYLKIKARPGANKTEVKSMLDGEEEVLKIDIAAAPEGGKANIELVKFLAKEFGVGKDGVKIISGAGDKIKLIKIVK